MINRQEDPEPCKKPSKLFPSAMIASIGVGVIFWVSLALILFWALRH